MNDLPYFIVNHTTSSASVTIGQSLPLSTFNVSVYDVDVNEVMQDNKSAILLEKNGKKRSGKRTRALNVRCFANCGTSAFWSVDLK